MKFYSIVPTDTTGSCEEDVVVRRDLKKRGARLHSTGPTETVALDRGGWLLMNQPLQ